MNPFITEMELQTWRGGPEWALGMDGMKNDWNLFTRRACFKW